MSILAGLVQDELLHSISGWPGLGEVPGLKYLFSTQQTERIKDELFFMLVPHVVRAVDDHTGTAHEVETGSGETVRLNRVPSQPVSQTK